MINYIQITLLLITIGLLLYGKKPKSPIAKKSNRIMILDTCALIDGRIIELSKSGFVPDELIVPEFILHELQLLADGRDAQKRARARFGLDVVKELQNGGYCTVTISAELKNDSMPIDDRLVAVAKSTGAQLYTTDYNLNKVADIGGVRVLNVNELAQHLRPVALPGEQKTIQILQRGSNRDQGVGYLDDGTMVVVDGAAKLIGKPATIEVSRMHQTVAGKMLFATLVGNSSQPKNKNSKQSTKPRLDQNHS